MAAKKVLCSEQIYTAVPCYWHLTCSFTPSVESCKEELKHQIFSLVLWLTMSLKIFLNPQFKMEANNEEMLQN